MYVCAYVCAHAACAHQAGAAFKRAAPLILRIITILKKIYQEQNHIKQLICPILYIALVITKIQLTYSSNHLVRQIAIVYTVCSVRFRERAGTCYCCQCPNVSDARFIILITKS